MSGFDVYKVRNTMKAAIDRVVKQSQRRREERGWPTNWWGPWKNTSAKSREVRGQLTDTNN